MVGKVEDEAEDEESDMVMLVNKGFDTIKRMRRFFCEYVFTA
jgi:hypothetical protein